MIAENIVRLRLKQDIVWTVIVIKFSVTAYLMIPGWAESLCPVTPPDFAHAEPLSGIGYGVVATKDDWFAVYREHTSYALVAGALMAAVSRISHVLTKPGALRHESYMSFYAYLTASMTIPLLIFMQLSEMSTKRKEFPTGDF